jgi:hypothetical protein
MDGSVTLDVGLLEFVVYIFLPWVVDLVTKRWADGKVKSAVLAVLAIVATLVQEAMLSGGTFSIADYLGKLVTALATAFLFHQYVWQPIGITGDKGIIMKAVPAGVGDKDPNKTKV